MMDLLVKALDVGDGSDPGHVQAGSIVEVREAGGPWGELEVPPVFFRLRVSDLESADDLEMAVSELTETVLVPDPENALEVHEQTTTLRSRRMRISFDLLPASTRDALYFLGEAEMTVATLMAAMRHDTE